LNFLTFFLLFNTMIPISLYVTLEVIKMFQGYFVSHDLEMIDIKRNIGTKVQCVSIMEELGQINYIFSDKTGTLTCNVLYFKKSMIGNQLYG